MNHNKMDQQSASQFLTYVSYTYPNYNDTNDYYDNQLKKVDKASTENYVEVLINLANESLPANLPNNIFNLAFQFSMLVVNKDRKSQRESSFNSSYSQKTQLTTNKKILDFLSHKKVQDKNLAKFVKGTNITSIKQQTSQLCFLIVLYCLQDKKKFKNLKNDFTGVTTVSEFIRTFKLSKAYLVKLKELIKSHELRSSFGCVVIDTLSSYNTKALQKYDLSRQHSFCKFIQRYFYLRNNQICLVLQQLAKYFGHNLFVLGLQLLSTDCKEEFEKYISILAGIHTGADSGVLFKRRVIVGYKSLILDEKMDDFRLEKYPKTISFFYGLCFMKEDFKKMAKIDPVNIKNAYYALGVLLRNYLFLIDMENLIKLAIKNQKDINDSYLDRCLHFLYDKDNYPELYVSGFKAIKSTPGFNDKSDFRVAICQVQAQIERLVKARNEREPRKKRNYIDIFLKEQKSINFKHRYVQDLKSNLDFVHLFEVSSKPSTNQDLIKSENNSNLLTNSYVSGSWSNESVEPNVTTSSRSDSIMTATDASLDKWLNKAEESISLGLNAVKNEDEPDKSMTENPMNQWIGENQTNEQTLNKLFEKLTKDEPIPVQSVSLTSSILLSDSGRDEEKPGLFNDEEEELSDLNDSFSAKNQIQKVLNDSTNLLTLSQTENELSDDMKPIDLAVDANENKAIDKKRRLSDQDEVGCAKKIKLDDQEEIIIERMDDKIFNAELELKSTGTVFEEAEIEPEIEKIIIDSSSEQEVELDGDKLIESDLDFLQRLVDANNNKNHDVKLNGVENANDGEMNVNEEFWVELD